MTTFTKNNHPSSSSSSLHDTTTNKKNPQQSHHHHHHHHRQTRVNIRQRQDIIHPYTYISSSHQLRDSLIDIAESYPDFTTLTTAQDAFENLSQTTAGNVRDCPFDRISRTTTTTTSSPTYYDRLKRLHEMYVARGERGFPTLMSSSSSGRGMGGSSGGCLNWILTIHDATTAYGNGYGGDGSSTKKNNATTSSSFNNNNDVPDVLLLGSLHGNELLSPTALLSTIHLLLSAASCESHPRPPPPSSSSSETNDAPPNNESRNDDDDDDDDDELSHARKCRHSLQKTRGLNDSQRRWLARLVATRRIVILPVVNALGFDRVESAEDGIDVRGDFPHGLLSGSRDDVVGGGGGGVCMRTVAARVVNEVVRCHAFRLGLTFHAGSYAGVSYGWGGLTTTTTLSSSSNKTPDDVAMREVSDGYARYGGGFRKRLFVGRDKIYPVNRRRDVMEPLRGNIEDWSYAASWDRDHVATCHPETYGGYNETRTIYDNATLRMVNTFVGISTEPSPDDPHCLGTDKYVLDPKSSGNGHIPRNIRLSLMAIDLAEPYVAITGYSNNELTDDIVPRRTKSYRSCMKEKALTVPERYSRVTIHWTVGGGFTVDDAGLLYVKWSDLPDVFNCDTNPPPDRLYDDFLHVIQDGDDDNDYDNYRRFENISIHHVKPSETTTLPGRTKWHSKGPYPTSPSLDGNLERDLRFRAVVDMSHYKEGDDIAVISYAKLDQGWRMMSNSDDDDGGGMAPQSHLVNARTNPEWNHVTECGKRIQGRLYYFSVPLTLTVTGGNDIDIRESSNRFPPSSFYKFNQSSPLTTKNNNNNKIWSPAHEKIQQLLHDYDTRHDETVLYYIMCLVPILIMTGLACYAGVSVCREKIKRRREKRHFQKLVDDERQLMHQDDNDDDDDDDDHDEEDDGGEIAMSSLGQKEGQKNNEMNGLYLEMVSGKDEISSSLFYYSHMMR